MPRFYQGSCRCERGYLCTVWVRGQASAEKRNIVQIPVVHDHQIQSDMITYTNFSDRHPTDSDQMISPMAQGGAGLAAGI